MQNTRYVGNMPSWRRNGIRLSDLLTSFEVEIFKFHIHVGLSESLMYTPVFWHPATVSSYWEF